MCEPLNLEMKPQFLCMKIPSPSAAALVFVAAAHLLRLSLGRHRLYGNGHQHPFVLRLCIQCLLPLPSFRTLRLKITKIRINLFNGLDPPHPLILYHIMSDKNRSEPHTHTHTAFGQYLISNTEIFLWTPLCFAAVNLQPINPGHVLVCPRRQVERFAQLTKEEVSELWITVQRVRRGCVCMLV